jgi:hypothetical protein
MATSYVTDAMEAHVHESHKAGGDVALVCTDGDSTPTPGRVSV